MPEFSAKADRTTGMFAFVGFIMSFMGALLLALVPPRNAVPGQPPIGSAVDFGAFFIIEALIFLFLITTGVVIQASRREVRRFDVVFDGSPASQRAEPRCGKPGTTSRISSAGTSTRLFDESELLLTSR
ncbi:DUF4436 family protein [Lentzea fradiae]|uniref:DUF4436 family protein n=1 Tax=Lentzea fradiae TaxID=200378 RepID=UPI000B7D68B1|nr:DUF4436 family protein [Lentzea fradiae]